MNHHKHSVPAQPPENAFSVHPKVFVFFDRKTSAPRFEVKANPDGKMPVDQVVGLLAMNCLMRGQTPKDYVVMVGTGENLLEGLASRASKLIHASLSLNSQMQLSHRQQEVLRAVMENLSNKEIAQRLHFSERTAKFHVSALLGKFNVHSRVLLMRTAADLLAAGKLFTTDSVTQLQTRESRQKNGARNCSRDTQDATGNSERRVAKSLLVGA